MSRLERTVGIYTLGCKVNQYESEAIAEGLSSRGFSVVPVSQICENGTTKKPRDASPSAIASDSY